MPTPRLIAFASESGQMADKHKEQEEGDRQEVVFTVLQGDGEEREEAAERQEPPRRASFKATRSSSGRMLQLGIRRPQRG